MVAVRKVLAEGLPEGSLLNINIPAKEIKGVRVTRQGIKNARPVISEHIDPRGSRISGSVKNTSTIAPPPALITTQSIRVYLGHSLEE